MAGQEKLIADRHVRQAIRTEADRSVVVEASAGTGKTTLLTDRVCEMVHRGTPLDSMAVVTFTEAAAAELRTRIREKLDPKYLKRMDQAWIHTIHGFASRILREYYYLCGGAPEFQVETSHFSRAELEIEWDLFLASRSKADLQVSSEGLRHPGSTAFLDAAEEMEKRRWLREPSLLGDTAGEVQRLVNKWLPVLESLPGRCTDGEDKLRQALLKVIRSLREGKPGTKVNARLGRADSWGGRDEKTRIFELLTEYNGETEFLDELRVMAPAEPALDKLVFPFVEGIRQKWDSDPTRLAFSDLLHLAGRAVAGSRELRAILSEKFRYVFIDEFQDTSMTQVSLFTSLLEASGLARKLTVVGDPKQSIYGWRSADIETYKETVELMETRGALSTSISVNFRSSTSIIDFVNSFGEALFASALPGEEPFGSRYSAIEPSPWAVPGQGVRVHTFEKPGKGISRADYYAQLQAEQIAELIKDPGNTAVLFRTRTRVDELLRELDRRGIAYRVEAGRDFHHREEVRDTASLLRRIIHPADTHSEIRVLRSMYFGINDREISSWKLGKPPSKGIETALSLIERLRETAVAMPSGVLVREIFLNTCILQTIRLSGYQVERRLANMRYILEEADRADDCSLLLETLEGKAPVSAEEPSSPPEPGHGTVTVTTIHRAKGLAWKHVILANPGSSFNGVTDTVLEDPRNERAGLRLAGGMTVDYPGLLEREKLRRYAEFRRLVYVAVTRPRERLDIFLEPISSGSSSVTPCGIIHKALATSENYIGLTVPVRKVSMQRGTFPMVPEDTSTAHYTPVVKEPVPGSDAERGRAMRQGTEVHRIMEFIDLHEPEAWLEENMEMLEDTLEFPRRAAELARSFFSTFSMKGARLVGREYPLIAAGRFFYVDLLIERNGVLEAVDYKTDTADPRERAEFYRPHQELYARELARATGKRVRTFLVFLHHRETIEIGPGVAPEPQ